jgi:hypothetical protein
MATVTAEVLTREIPVTQVVVDDLEAGVPYVVIGRTGESATWPVAGGVGVSDGEQIALIDARAPFNVAVAYELTYPGGYALSNTVTLPLLGADVVLATLDGSLEAVPNSLGAGEFPRGVTPRSVVYDVPGRARGPVRWSLAARTGSQWVLHCDRWASDDLDALLATGRPLVYRLATRVRDLPPTDLFVVTEVESVSFPDDEAWRTWTITFEYIDDPEPSTKPVVTTWDQFDEIYADSTWDAFDAQWADYTWNDFDTFDWGTLQ